MVKSLVILTKVSALEQANAICDLAGWGDDNFRVPLGPAATGQTTHRGLRATVEPKCVATMEQLLKEKPELSAAIILDTRADDQRHEHFEAALNAAGLVRVVPPDID